MKTHSWNTNTFGNSLLTTSQGYFLWSWYKDPLLVGKVVVTIVSPDICVGATSVRTVPGWDEIRFCHNISTINVTHVTTQIILLNGTHGIVCIGSNAMMIISFWWLWSYWISKHLPVSLLMIFEVFFDIYVFVWAGAHVMMTTFDLTEYPSISQCPCWWSCHPQSSTFATELHDNCTVPPGDNYFQIDRIKLLHYCYPQLHGNWRITFLRR